MKFKEGDKVRIINREPSNITGNTQWYSDINNSIGIECYICSNINNESYQLRSNKDGTGEYYGLLLSYKYETICFNECDLELVTDKPQYEIY